MNSSTAGAAAAPVVTVLGSGDFFKNITAGNLFQVDGTQYQATGGSTYVYGVRGPDGPFKYRIPTTAGTISVKVYGGYSRPLTNSIETN